MTVLLRWGRTIVSPVVFLILVSTACAVHEPITSVEPTEALPEAFSGGSTLPPVDRWWEQFENQDLERLINEALSGNLTLRMAWARLEQARQLSKIAGAGQYPGLELGFGIQQYNAGGSLPPDSPESLREFTGTLTLSYQADLWKKITNNRLAAILDFEAGREDLEATALTITASVAELWAALAEQDAFLLLLEDQLEVGKDYLRLVEARFGRGISSAVDVYQQRLLVENIREQFPKTKMQHQLLQHQLAILLGKKPKATIPLTRNELPLLKEPLLLGFRPKICATVLMSVPLNYVFLQLIIEWQWLLQIVSLQSA